MRTRPTLAQLGDDWYASEEPISTGVIHELRRVRQRTIVRPLPVLVLAALLTAAVMYRITHRQRTYPAEVILALTEGTMGTASGVHAEQLREYVTSVLMADNRMLEVIERHDLFPLRKRLGPQFGLGELWSQIVVEIWKNSFIYFHEWDADARKSARIGITFTDQDPDRAYAVAQDLARTVIAAHDAERAKLTGGIAREVRSARDSLQARLRDITVDVAFKQVAMATAQQQHKDALVAALHVGLLALDSEAKKVEQQLALIINSPEVVADEISEAGLDLTLGIVEERRPARSDLTPFVLALIGVIVGSGALGVSALLLGAFDSRVHDTDDVERLGLPVLGHVPAFTGDHVGSLRARAAARPHHSSVMRWLSLR